MEQGSFPGNRQAGEPNLELERVKKYGRIEALWSSEQLFFKTFYYLPNPMTFTTFEGIVVEVNGGFSETLGYSREEVVGRNVLELAWDNPQDRMQFVQILKDKGAVNKMEARFRHKNGIVVVGLITSIQVDISGDVYILSSVVDISDRIEAKENMERYRLLFGGIRDIVLLVDLQGRIIDANHAAVKAYGYSRDELLRLSVGDLRGTEKLNSIDKQMQQANKRGILFQTWHIRKDGSLFPVEISSRGTTIKQKRYLLSVVRDMTERQQTEELRRQDSDEIFDLYNNAPCGYHSLDENGVYIRVNDTELNWLGYAREEVLGRKFIDFLTEESAKRQRTGYSKFKMQGSVNNLEFELICRDGSILPVLLNSTAVMDAQGNFLMSRAIMTSIKERKKVEELRRKDAQEILDLYNHAPCGYVSVDANNVFMRINDTTLEWMGVKREEVIGRKKVADFLTPKSKDYFKKIFPQYKGKGEASDLEFEMLRRDGSIMTVLVNARAILDAKGIYAMGNVILTDITERKKMEEALSENEEKYRSIFENAVEGIFQALPNNKYISLNPAGARMFGYVSPEEMMEAISEVDQTYVNPHEWKNLRQLINEQGFVADCMVERIRKDGSTFWTLLNAHVVYDAKGKFKHVDGSYVDVTERKRAQDRVTYLSEHDALTGLYNRSYFERILSSPESERFAGIIMCDIDGLKLVNDSLGNKAGDEILIAAAEAIKKCFKGDEMIARVGGDEFAILLPKYGIANLNNKARQIQHEVESYNAREAVIPLSISTGMAQREDRSGDIYELIKTADNSMYRHKLRSSQSARSAMVKTLMKTLEARDFGTENHAVRLVELMRVFSQEVSLPTWKMEDLMLFAQFHDIGKVGIPDRILFKPGPLNPEERFEMQKHSEIGYRIAQAAPDLVHISEFIIKHHEWWNGEGYPLGLKGTEIPLECRMLSIVDAYDAMTCDRPYRKAMSRDEAINELRACQGKQFDPDLVDIFLQSIANVSQKSDKIAQ